MLLGDDLGMHSSDIKQVVNSQWSSTLQNKQKFDMFYWALQEFREDAFEHIESLNSFLCWVVSCGKNLLLVRMAT